MESEELLDRHAKHLGGLGASFKPVRPPRRGGSFESETGNLHSLCGEGPCPAKVVFYLLNMDIQDGQDKQQETLLHGKRTGCVFPHPNPRGVPY